MRKYKHPYRIRNVFVRLNPMRLLPGRHRDRYPNTLRELFEESAEKYHKRKLSCYVDGSNLYTYRRFRDVCDQ